MIQIHESHLIAYIVIVLVLAVATTIFAHRQGAKHQKRKLDWEFDQIIK